MWWYVVYSRGHKNNIISDVKTKSYDEGYQQGYIIGKEEGWRKGESDGMKEGLSIGKKKGKLDGYDDGVSKGYKTGCEDTKIELKIKYDSEIAKLKEEFASKQLSLVKENKLLGEATAQDVAQIQQVCI